MMRLISFHLLLFLRHLWSDSAADPDLALLSTTTQTVVQEEKAPHRDTGAARADQLELNVVFMLPFTSDGFPYIAGSVAPAIIIGIRHVSEEILPNCDLYNWEIIDTESDAQRGVRKFTDLFKRYKYEFKVKIHGIIGPESSELGFTIGFIAAAYNISEVASGCDESTFSNRRMYPTFARTTFNVDKVMPGLAAKLVTSMRLVNMAVLSTLGSRQRGALARAVAGRITDLMGTQFNLTDVQVAPLSLNDQSNLREVKAKLIHTLMRMKTLYFTVYFLLAPMRSVKYILQLASVLGMLGGQNLFIVPSYAVAAEPQPDFDFENGIMVINYKMPDTDEYQAFLDKLVSEKENTYKDERLKPYIKQAVNSASQIHYSAGLLYDALTMWALGVNKSFGDEHTAKNGTVIADEIRTVNFEGVTGQVNLTDDNQRIMNFAIRVIQNGSFVTVGEYHTTTETLTIDQHILRTITWPGGTKKMPGLEKGDKGDDQEKIVAIIVGCSFAAFVILIVLLVVIIRKMKFEMELQAVSHLLIKRSDINVYIHPRKARQENYNQHAIPGGFNIAARDEIRSFETFVINQWTDVGYYQEKKVVMKLMKNQKMNAKDRKLLAEIVHVKKLHHDNLNPVLGVCIEPPNNCIVMAYCSKGSLWDVITNHTIPMTWDFRMAIAMDIAKGMEYLHMSAIGSHGHLTSTNCMIDGRWTCKITDHGLSYFRRGYLLLPDTEMAVATDEDYKGYVWTAPELLRMSVLERPLNGTRKADVYSYGIIIQEICYQQKPFGFCYFTFGPYGIVREVAAGQNPPFRPLEPDDKAEMTGDTAKFSRKWMGLMESCWNEDPVQRPTFSQILKQLLIIHEGRPIRAIDNMVKMLESYTTRLENIVYERNQLVVDEKKKADQLLYSILPKFVAEQLKEGHKVLPEQFDAVSIFLSDIVGFTALAAASTPIQVVNFLGLLYNSFDEIIDKNNVYKVETIGDAYVVASGLPVRNGNAHVIQIALFALDILSLILGFKIPHKPRRPLEIRIGLHTGPVLAGVVGLKMPRYCLFGTTVGTADYMQHTSPVNSIHASDTTGALLLEHGSFILAEYTKMDYEDKKNAQTYRLRGRSVKRPSVPDVGAHLAVPSHLAPADATKPRRGSVPGHIRP